MSRSSDWADGVGYRWLEALELAAAPWAQPLLEAAGLPATLAARQQVVADIARRAKADREALLRSTKGVDQFPGLDGAITREVVVNAVHRLADALSPEEARAFESWARRDFVGDHRRVLLPWQFVLTHFVVNPPDPETPGELQALRPPLQQLLGNDAERAIAAQLQQLAPPPSPQDRELGLDLAAEAEQLKEVIDAERTLAALRLIRENTTPTQRRPAVEWASRLARHLGMPADVADTAAMEHAFDYEREAAAMPSALSLPLARGDANRDHSAEHD